VGQGAITTALQNQILADKVGHAYLFTGTRGTGKTTCAKLFAKAVNCEDRSGADPCGKCESCLGAENGSILDVTEIDAASNNSVDDVRTLRDETVYRPSRGRYRVYIIDEVHMLSTSAFNALLKIMEEPPEHVIFILATTEVHKVPATILSRCQRYDFLRIDAAAIAQRLQYVAGQEGIALTDGAADLIARLADGAMRDGLSLLDTCAGAAQSVDEELVRRMAGVADREYLFALSSAAAAEDTAEVVRQVAALRERSIDVKRLAEELMHHYRTLLLAASASDGSLLGELPAAERPRYLRTGVEVGEAGSIYALRRLTAALDKMSRAPDPRIELELALFDLGNVGGETPQPKAQPKPAQQAVQPAQAVPAIETQQVTVSAPRTQEVPMEEAASPVKEPEKAAPQAQQQAVEDGSVVAFDLWPQVVARMAEEDGMLHSFMKSSMAYTDGRRVLIDGGKMFLEYMRDKPENGDKVKTIIEQVAGKRYGIGPYDGQSTAKIADKTQETLQQWESLGVPIEWE
jgi:DNA polymerase-3 subunit gamma/tau